MRTLLALLLLLPVAVQAADGDLVSYEGRQVAAVIDEFRDAGYPFVYSTNLVTDELMVVVEPDATKPLEIIKQILKTHGLAIRSEKGVYLVVRYDSEGLATGNNLLVVVTPGRAEALETATVSVDPRLEISPQLM